MSELRSSISKARGLGSAKTGTTTYMIERLTSIALVPLGIWFVVNVLGLALSQEEVSLQLWLQSPFCALMMVLFVFFSFWHSKMGVTVIIEDYVHAPFWRNSLMLINASFHIILGLISLMAVVKLHFMMDVPL
jgi:succinate dehydrogenase / fumarate reductase membrane anchor subunit